MNHLHHKVSALVDGELSQSARARALTHARNCGQCRREIAETLEVKQRINRLTPAETSLDLLAMVALAPSFDELATALGPGAALLRRVIVSVGSMTAIVIVLAYVVGGPEVAQAPPVNPPVKEFAAEFVDSTGLAPLSDPAVDTWSESSAPSMTPIAFGTTAAAQSGVGAPTAPPLYGDQPAAVRLLREAVRAPDRVAFRGVRTVRSYGPGGPVVLAVEVNHVPGQGTMFDVLGQQDQGDNALFVAAGAGAEAGLESSAIGSLLAAFDVTVGATERILGRQVSVVTASQLGQVKARFWIDDATGILLRRAMYDDGHLVRWSGFTSITIARHAFMRHLPPEVPVPPTTTLSSAVISALNDKGWTYPERLSNGFHLSLIRELDTAGGVMHANYTNGLCTVAVFEERGSLNASSLAGFRSVRFLGDPMYIRDGLPLTVVWQSGDTVFTVVTDLPDQLASTLIARLPHTVGQAQGAGVPARIGDGLSRLVSAIAP